jgi:hypothetical protein
VLADFVNNFDTEGIVEYIKKKVHFRDVIVNVVVSLID